MVHFSKFILGASLLSIGIAAPHQKHQKKQTATKYLFSFGDSYTATGFDVNGVQPGPGNPGGNPTPLGASSFSGGPVYPEYIATAYNTTFVQLYDFAYGGATISDSIVPTDDASIDTFEEQVTLRYEPKYSTPGADAVPWTADSGFFTIFFGINDIGLSYQTADVPSEIPALISKYTSLMDNLYSTGARKLLIVGVPPVDRSASVIGDPNADPAAFSDAINSFNGQLAAAVTNWAGANSDANVQIFDYHAWLTAVLDNPTQYGFQDATCAGAGDSNCIWWEGSNYHPTSTLQNLVAQAIADQMDALGW